MHGCGTAAAKPNSFALLRCRHAKVPLKPAVRPSRIGPLLSVQRGIAHARAHNHQAPTQSTRAIPHAKSHTHKPTHARAHAHTSHVHAFHARARRQSPPAGGAPESIRDGRRRLDQPHVVPPEPARLPMGHHRLPMGHYRLPMAPHFRAESRSTAIACGLWQSLLYPSQPRPSAGGRQHRLVPRAPLLVLTVAAVCP